MKNRKIIYGVIVLLLIGLALVYYTAYRGEKNDDSKNEPSINDSTRTDDEATPAEMGAGPEKNAADGSVKIVEEFIKVNAKNPATFEFLEWSDVSIEGGYWKVRCKYRGISSFGAEVTTNAWFYIKNDKVIYTKIISKI